jgi:2-amino-4-hydroxy-6-hydroxymethyldihydropteridine diphosphokinase
LFKYFTLLHNTEYQSQLPSTTNYHTAWIGLGTNLGDRFARLQQARQLLENELDRPLRTSPVYETAAWGITDQPAFLNQIVEIQTTLGPFALLDLILEIEQKMGRIRMKKWGERLIDLDILLYDSLMFRSDRLVIPHPYLTERRFVLAPLADIIPDRTVPGCEQTVSQLLTRCRDQSTAQPL